MTHVLVGKCGGISTLEDSLILGAVSSASILTTVGGMAALMKYYLLPKITHMDNRMMKIDKKVQTLARLTRDIIITTNGMKNNDVLQEDLALYDEVFSENG